MDTMITSDESDKVIPAFVKALNAMEDIPRTESVAAGPMRYKFAPLDVVLDVARPHLRDNGLALTQVPTTTEGVYTVIWHESGQWIRFAPLFIAATGGTPQNVGSAITYSRRYSILSILGLATEDDDGRAASVAAAPPTHDPRTGRVDEMLRRLSVLGEDEKAEIKAWAEGESKRLSGKALYEDPEWLDMVESYLDVLEGDRVVDEGAEGGY